MNAAAAIWLAGLLVVVLLVVPLLLLLVFRLVRAAWSIEHYFACSLEAAKGIAQHTADIAELKRTIEIAGPILNVAASISERSGAIKDLLLERAGKGA